MATTDSENTMLKRAKILGVVLTVAGLVMSGTGFLYGLRLADDGLASAQALYEAQGVTLSYDKNGTLTDHGSTEAAQKIMDLLVKEWKYPVNMKSFNPKDPLVNTRDELMYQYATITEHVLTSTVAVKLTDKDVTPPFEYRGITYSKNGTYNVTVEKFYAEMDRANPIEKQLRDAWTPQALALTGILATGHANQATGELAQATSLGIGGIGLLFVVAGVGIVWVCLGRKPT